jgi:putative FmdB family regulatory protein
MPTYEYACEKCGHTFEHQQPIVEPPLALCPADKCQRKKWGKGKVRRGIGGGAGLIFKGSGFYITDYRSEGYKQAAHKDSNASPSTPAAGGGEGAKPAAPKTEPKAAAVTKPTKP